MFVRLLRVARRPSGLLSRAAALTVCAALAVRVSPAAEARAPALEGRSPGQVAGYQIVRLGRGPHNRLCLAATIEGTRGLMFVDTGSSGTVLVDAKYGFLKPGADRKLPTGAPATTRVNYMNCPVGLARDFHIGHCNLGASAVALVGARFLYDSRMLYAPGSERQYDGLIGENLLRRARAVLDCGRMALYLNTDPARRVNLGQALVRAGWTRVPMEDFGRDFIVPCTIQAHAFRAIVDTGAPYTTFDPDRLRLAGLQAREVPMAGGVIGTHGGRVGFLSTDALRVGDYVAAQSHVVTSPGLSTVMSQQKAAPLEAPLIGLLGGNFLADNGAVIDVGDHALYLRRATSH